MQIKIKIEKLFFYDQKQKVGLLELFETLYFGKSEGGNMKNALKKSFFWGFGCLSLQIETTFFS